MEKARRAKKKTLPKWKVFLTKLCLNGKFFSVSENNFAFWQDFSYAAGRINATCDDQIWKFISFYNFFVRNNAVLGSNTPRIQKERLQIPLDESFIRWKLTPVMTWQSFWKQKKLSIFGKFRNKNFAKIASDIILGPTLSGATQITYLLVEMFLELINFYLLIGKWPRPPAAASWPRQLAAGIGRQLLTSMSKWIN